MTTDWCCSVMQRMAEPRQCPQHLNGSCPDQPIERWSHDTYVLRILDGGTSAMRIDFCPFCGLLLNS